MVFRRRRDKTGPNCLPAWNGQFLGCSSAYKLRNLLCCVSFLSLGFWIKDLAHGLKWSWSIRRSGSHGSLQCYPIAQMRYLWVSILLSGNSSTPRWNYFRMPNCWWFNKSGSGNSRFPPDLFIVCFYQFNNFLNSSSHNVFSGEIQVYWFLLELDQVLS